MSYGPRQFWDGEDWEIAGDEERDHYVFGSLPTVEEVEEASSDLQNALRLRRQPFIIFLLENDLGFGLNIVDTSLVLIRQIVIRFHKEKCTRIHVMRIFSESFWKPSMSLLCYW